MFKTVSIDGVEFQFVVLDALPQYGIQSLLTIPQHKMRELRSWSDAYHDSPPAPADLIPMLVPDCVQHILKYILNMRDCVTLPSRNIHYNWNYLCDLDAATFASKLSGQPLALQPARKTQECVPKTFKTLDCN